MNTHEFNIVDILTCPDCQSGIVRFRDGLKCEKCQRQFEVRRGIPILYPSDSRADRQKCEETLAEMMAESLIGRNDDFSGRQWQASKNEFWRNVTQNIGPSPTTLLNVGCGYDTGFHEFQSKGHSFVNFDLVYGILDVLKHRHGAEYCVAGDANRPPFKDASFDCLTCIDLIHHECERLSQLLKGFHSLLKPGGVMFLEDVNAWAIFQFPKSVLLPKSSFRGLRAFYYSNVRRTQDRPADYEFPTNPFEVERILKRLGFSQIVFFRNYAYPIGNEKLYKVYRFFGDNERFAKFHNFHYSLMARKS